MSIAEGANPIAVCEAAMIPLALSLCCERIREREVLFFIDNSVALYSMVRGGSNQRAVARCTHLMGITCLNHTCKVWFEFVDSKSNWADSISRTLAECRFCREKGIPVAEVTLPIGWWNESLEDLMRKGIDMSLG